MIHFQVLLALDNQSLCLTVWLVFSKTVKDHKISSADFIISFAPFEISSLRFLRFSYKPLNEWRNVKMTDAIPNLYIRLEEFSLHKQISNKISYRRRKLKLWSRFQAVLLSEKKLQWNNISRIGTMINFLRRPINWHKFTFLSQFEIIEQ